MGFMDKVKAQAEVAVAKAQQGVAQGQAKIEDLQGKRAADALLLALGHAFYAEQRTGGSKDDVVAALAAVDAHAAANGPIAAPEAAAAAGDPTGATGQAGPASPGGTTTPPAAAEGASFSLDDI
jgi:hypothetical protein